MYYIRQYQKVVKLTFQNFCQATEEGTIVKFSQNLTCGAATISRLLKIIGLFCKRAQ